MGELTDARPPDDTRALIRRLEKEIGRLEKDLRITTALSAKVTNVPTWTAPKRRPAHKFVAAPVLLLSDWHFGEVVDRRVMDGFNEYNDDIANARWERVIHEVPDMLGRHLNGYQHPYLVTALMGDMISGDIHDELAKTNEFTSPETIVRWVPRIAAGLRYLADETGIDRIVVPCVDGNHDRIDKRTPMKRRAEASFTWLIYHSVAMALDGDDRFNFIISRSSDVRVPIYDQAHLFVHGDGARGGGGIGGIWPPIMRYVNKLTVAMQAQGRPVDHVAMGHWHQLVTGSGGLSTAPAKATTSTPAACRSNPNAPNKPCTPSHPTGASSFHPRRYTLNRTCHSRHGDCIARLGHHRSARPTRRSGRFVASRVRRR